MAIGDGTCGRVWGWIIQIAVWAAVIFMIVAIVLKDQDLMTAGYVTAGVTVLVYWICSFCAATCCYLLHPKGGGDIYGYMQQLFYTPAHLDMYVQCYHYETRVITERDAQGNTHTRTEQYRVNTHSANERFFYVSWRDISGSFVLDTGAAMANQKKAFVKLHLGLRLEFAGDGTEQDYTQQREFFKARNRLDVYQDYWEKTSLAGYDEHNLVKVSDYNPPCFGLGWYLLFTFILFVEFYKAYVDKYCIPQKFGIKKVVSTRRDLNKQEYMVEYQQFIPCIVYMGETKAYDAPTQMPQMQPPPGQGQDPNIQMQVQMSAGPPGPAPPMQPPGAQINFTLSPGLPQGQMQIAAGPVDGAPQAAYNYQPYPGQQLQMPLIQH